MDPSTLTIVLSAISTGIVVGLFKGGEILVARHKNGSADKNGGGDRGVTAAECRANHANLDQDLRRGSDRFAQHGESVAHVERLLLRLQGDMQAGFAGIEGTVTKAVSDEIRRHESGPFHPR